MGEKWRKRIVETLADQRPILGRDRNERNHRNARPRSVTPTPPLRLPISFSAHLNASAGHFNPPAQNNYDGTYVSRPDDANILYDTIAAGESYYGGAQNGEFQPDYRDTQRIYNYYENGSEINQSSNIGGFEDDEATLVDYGIRQNTAYTISETDNEFDRSASSVRAAGSEVGSNSGHLGSSQARCSTPERGEQYIPHTHNNRPSRKSNKTGRPSKSDKPDKYHKHRDTGSRQNQYASQGRRSEDPRYDTDTASSSGSSLRSTARYGFPSTTRTAHDYGPRLGRADRNISPITSRGQERVSRDAEYIAERVLARVLAEERGRREAIYRRSARSQSTSPLHRLDQVGRAPESRRFTYSAGRTDHRTARIRDWVSRDGSRPRSSSRSSHSSTGTSETLQAYRNEPHADARSKPLRATYPLRPSSVSSTSSQVTAGFQERRGHSRYRE